MTWTELIASYGAILSTLGIGWNLHRDLRDRGILRVDASFGLKMAVPSGETEQCLFVSITNVGRRPIMASIVGGAWKLARKEGDHFTFIPNDLPKLLKPGESHTETYEQRVWCNILTPDLKAIWVRDAVGKLWRVSKKNIRNLIGWGGVVN